MWVKRSFPFFLCVVLVWSAAVQADVGCGVSYNTYVMADLNQKVISKFRAAVSYYNTLFAQSYQMSGSLSEPREINSGLGYFVEGRFWLLKFLGIGFQLEHLQGKSTASGLIEVNQFASIDQTDLSADLDVTLGVKVKATGYSGAAFFKYPLGLLDVSAKASVGYYPASLRFWATERVKVGSKKAIDLQLPDKLSGEVRGLYKASSMGLKTAFGLNIPLNPFTIGLNLGYRFLNVELGDLDNDGKSESLDFSGILLGLGGRVRF